MRKVINIPTAKVILCNALGRVINSFEVENGEAFLPIFNAELTFKAGGIPFFVYDGEGDLDFKDALKRYDFSQPFDKSFIARLDYHLQTREFMARTSPTQKKIIRNFVELFNLNLNKMLESSAESTQGAYIIFDDFENLESALYEYAI